jgi:hypothetical protein
VVERDYKITGNTDVAKLAEFNQFRFFPMQVQYNFSNAINFNMNYNKKNYLAKYIGIEPK